MNKYQIALWKMEELFSLKLIPYGINVTDVVVPLQELVDICPEYLELKERATPKKVKVVHSGRLYFDGLCPNCNRPLFDGSDMFFKEKHYQFCAYCGQALDWSEPTTDSTHNELNDIFANSLRTLERLKIKK